MAGRVSEEIFFGKITTGAYDDLEKAYRIAHAMVTKLGMDYQEFNEEKEQNYDYDVYKEFRKKKEN